MMLLSGPRSIVLLVGSLSLPVIACVIPAGTFQGSGKAKSNVKPAAVDGSAIFRQRCAECHGPKGEGGTGYPRPLVGTRTVSELAAFIKQSMPPVGKKCSVPEAQHVAAYMHSAFYSPVAQERIRPARVALSRLTVRQFNNAVADLLRDTSSVVPPVADHGLRGEYFRGRDHSAKGRVIDRTDREVNFDFGTDGPEPGKFDPHAFSATWQGSVFAPDTGDYEFIVQTDHATQFWINGNPKPLIDAGVKSGNDTEYRGVIRLIGGRSYPIRLEFTKASRGVDDTKKKEKLPPPKAFVNFRWRRPNHTAEVVTADFLYPVSVRPTYVVESKFPPDDRSIGYERGNSVSKEWENALTNAALEAADKIASSLPERTGIRDDANDRVDRFKQYCKRLVERAFRRPLDAELTETYINKQFRSAASPEIAVKRVVLLTLQSPRFLYHESGAAGQDPYGIASRLSFGLWDSLPDRRLLDLAAKGQLNTPEQIEKEATRMAEDPRAWVKLRDFLLRWLKLDEVPDIVKNAKKYPDFDAQTVSDLRTSLEKFLQATAWSENSDYRELLLSEQQFLNGRLAKLYGLRENAAGPFTEVVLEPGQRAGVLTHPYVLSRFAYLDTSSPIHRGVLVMRNLLGRTLQPPPAAFAPLAASLHPNMTTRERVSFQTKPAMCNACHSKINPLGFALEKFDAIGRLRSVENGKSIDSRGFYQARNGTVVKFGGAIDLARYLANSDEAHAAFVEKLFQHLVKQPILAYGPKTGETLLRKFAENRYSIRSLMVQIMLATTKMDAKESPGTQGTNP